MVGDEQSSGLGCSEARAGRGEGAWLRERLGKAERRQVDLGTAGARAHSWLPVPGDATRRRGRARAEALVGWRGGAGPLLEARRWGSWASRWQRWHAKGSPELEAVWGGGAAWRDCAPTRRERDRVRGIENESRESLTRGRGKEKKKKP